MIYRIAIYRSENGVRKFDHYATPEEMKYLRVNADGKVEIIESADSRSELPSHNLPCFKTGEWVAEDEYYSGSIYSQWLDVSATHEVEWGFVLEGNKYFQNDIIYNKHDKNKYLTIMWDADDCQFVIGESTDGYAGEMHLFNLPKWWTVIGNIHQHPELIAELGGKDE
jgi:hypothetical protein